MGAIKAGFLIIVIGVCIWLLFWPVILEVGFRLGW